jgi:DNA/RNA endonuclease G (NUC1)
VLGTNAVAVPTHFAKSVLTVPSEVEITMTTWLAPNTVPKAGTTIADWRITTDELERLAGLDLWAGLPDEIETQLEAPK